MREKSRDRRQKGDSSPAPPRPGSDFVMERFGSIRDMDRSFDIEYWQRQGDAAIYYPGKKDHHKRVTTERPHPTGGSCPREGHGKGEVDSDSLFRVF
ncbi:MAG: hypothetical protein ACXVBO_19335, partial [Isosphaeraceae bacterium]